jgi:hypothetical protein
MHVAFFRMRSRGQERRAGGDFISKDVFRH